MMKSFFQQKLFWGGFVGILIAVILFTFAFMGSTVNPTPKEIPLAIVVQDDGVALPNGQQLNFGKRFLEQVKKNDNESIDWAFLDSREKAVEGMNEKEYYATIVIPSSLSQNIFSLLTERSEKPEVEILVNEGMNATGAKMAGQMASRILSNLNTQVENNLYEQVESQQIPLSVEKSKLLTLPIQVTTRTLNSVGEHNANGNTPALFTQILWLTTFIGSMILFTAIKKLGLAKWTISSITSQILGGLLFVVSICGLVFWFADGVLDVSIPNGGDMFALLLFIGMMFFFIQGGLLNWIGYAAAPIFVLLFFFSMPVLTLPPEMLPDITKDWLYSWVPFRFSVEAFKDVLFFGVNPLDKGIGVLGYIGLAGLIMMLLAPFKPVRGEAKTKNVKVEK
ncbi:YhgE/Pip-like protein [Bacillus pakistanensis]|uniref:YhgE/Pip-like protein n=1 Tax=Rossellomorea pakistanensis TaxID=992288 RepID=A0ABS2NH25_9BACI|nr:YhgE/Pip family protein [Bacillus pakistanensis]MBM7587110.1 YhgE/Pip-like protein [Bacillus pakistanensis]